MSPGLDRSTPDSNRQRPGRGDEAAGLRQRQLLPVTEADMPAQPPDEIAAEGEEDDDLADRAPLRQEVDLAHRGRSRTGTMPASQLAVRMLLARTNPPDENVRRAVQQLVLHSSPVRERRGGRV